MKDYLTILFILYTFQLFGQSSCKCPDETIPDSIFRLANNYVVATCGGIKKNIDGKRCFSKFSLIECEANTVLFQFEEVDKYCMHISGNNLVMESMKFIPTGKNFKSQLTAWKIYKISFSEKGMKIIIEFNTNIPHASIRQRKSINIKFNELITSNNLPNEDIIGLLFYSAISGDKKSETYLLNLPDYFTLDGAVNEYYKEMKDALSDWIYIKSFVR